MVKKTNTKELIFQRILEKRKQLAFYGVKNIGLFDYNSPLEGINV